MTFASLILAAVLQYGSPVDFAVSLAGNFGEPRPNHFHGGIDVRTQQVEGKAIYSIADGYVSRLTVGLFGFGNAVYVTHPDGHTSVYCHLKKFAPLLAMRVRRWQYENQSYVADVRLKPCEFPVSQGQLIAISGNTGSSTAPHLHLELHNTRTWAMLDPLDYLKQFVDDNTPPTAHAFMAYPQEGEGVFCGGTAKQSFPFASHELTREFTAWGKVGFGIWANDYMEGAYNHYGIRNTKLYVDGRVVFEADVDSIPMECNRMVNSWGDYPHRCRSNVWYMKSFREPGNTLPLFSTVGDGIVDFNEERPYLVVYSLTDAFGNSSQYTFTVHGRKQDIPRRGSQKVYNIIRWDRAQLFQMPGLQLFTRKNLVHDNIFLRPAIKRQPGKLSDAYTLYGMSYPLFDWADISLRLNREVKDTTKLYIVCNYGSDRFNGGTFSGGWVTGKMRELGATYEIGYDDEPPTVSPVSLSGDVLKFSISDGKSGIRSYRGYIDGRFVLFEEVPKSSTVKCDLRKTPLQRTGKTRNLRFVVTDNRDNERVFEASLVY